ncbi:DoxX-like family protein [uncultured Pseudacidovorax sp.]|uniref:DoxX-like family protein n=1 Tax=uncultured Pseudacidovorax sp. TaxID=679313 RepID=UPI0025E311B5|nr:DoxX-like family protein [uncultured Pseudacidovorax sp.]
MTAAEQGLARGVLATLWLGTAAVSLIGLDGQSAALLQRAGVPAGHLADAIVWAGSLLDLALGLLLWLRPGRASAWLAMAGMALMTAAATLLLPSLWLDPLGPLLKNLPVALLLWLLARSYR